MFKIVHGITITNKIEWIVSNSCRWVFKSTSRDNRPGSILFRSFDKQHAGRWDWSGGWIWLIGPHFTVAYEKYPFIQVSYIYNTVRKPAALVLYVCIFQMCTSKRNSVLRCLHCRKVPVLEGMNISKPSNYRLVLVTCIQCFRVQQAYFMRLLPVICISVELGLHAKNRLCKLVSFHVRKSECFPYSFLYLVEPLTIK